VGKSIAILITGFGFGFAVCWMVKPCTVIEPNDTSVNVVQVAEASEPPPSSPADRAPVASEPVENALVGTKEPQGESVVAPKAVKAETPAPVELKDGPRTLMSYKDWKYLGAFNVPLYEADGTRTPYGGFAMTWMPEASQNAKDGTPGVVVVRGHQNQQKLIKIAIPAISALGRAKKRAAPLKDYRGAWDTTVLPSGTPIGKFFDPTGGYRAQIEAKVQDRVNIGGLAWIDEKLAYTLHRYFAAGGIVRFAGHGFQGSTRHWQLKPSARTRSPQRTGGYVCAAPKWWADKYTNGRRWLSGFNTPQIHSVTNLGPALYAYNPDESELENLPATILAEFPWSSRAPKIFEGTSRCDFWRGVAFLDDGKKYGVFFIGSRGTPDRKQPWLADDYGHGTSNPSLHRKPSGRDKFPWSFDPCDHTRGYHCYPYRPSLLAFDPDEYVAVIEGAKKPWKVEAYEEENLADIFVDGCRYYVCGIGVDNESGLLYIGDDWGHRDANRYEGTPCIHVWRWRTGS